MGSKITDGSGYSDLINNFNTFHAHYSEEDLLDFKGKWEDDSDYSKHRTLEDLVENATPEDYETSHVVSVWIPHINSSEESLGGGDRHFGLSQIVIIKKTQFSCLNREGKYRQSVAGYCLVCYDHTRHYLTIGYCPSSLVIIVLSRSY